MKQEHSSGKNSLLAKLRTNPTAVLALCAAAILLTTVVTLAAVNRARQNAAGSTASSAGSQTSTPSGGEEDERYESSDLDTEAYSGTILPLTEDAGEEYIKDTLFIGDSNTVRYMSYGFAELEHAIGVIGMGASDARTLKSVKFKSYAEMVTIPKAITIMQPQRIIIGFGTNNLTGDLDTYIKEYTKTIKAACRRAHIAPWGANRLRHTFATEVRRRFGLDAARAVLGHSTGLRVTDIYSRDAAEDDAIRTAAPAVEALG